MAQPAPAQAPRVPPPSDQVASLPDEPVATGAPTGTTAPAETVATLPDGGFRILFADGSDQLTDSGGRLLTGLAARLIADETLRIQVRAYADAAEDSASRARRLSLNRALTIRSFLIDRGVRGTRIDVRALGNTAQDGPMDRADLQVIS